MTDTADSRDIRLAITELRTELQQFRLEALKANADLATGIARDIRRLEAGQAQILSEIRRSRRGWWPF
jgi:hypothetical protein